MVVETSRASGMRKWTFHDELDVIFGETLATLGELFPARPAINLLLQFLLPNLRILYYNIS